MTFISVKEIVRTDDGEQKIPVSINLDKVAVIRPNGDSASLIFFDNEMLCIDYPYEKLKLEIQNMEHYKYYM